SVLVPADAGDANEEPSSGLPEGVRTPYQLGAFFDELASRTTEHGDPARVEDSATGVVVVGGFTKPITGRLARVRAAEAAVETAREANAAAEEAADEAERNLQRARTRLDAASASERAEGIEEKL